MSSFVRFELMDTNGELIGRFDDYTTTESVVNEMYREDVTAEFEIYGVTSNGHRVLIY